MNQNLKSSSGSETVGNRSQALGRIADAIKRFAETHDGHFPSLVQVGDRLFDIAFPDKVFPHKVGSVGEVCVFPRPDILGEWGLSIPKPGPAKVA